MKTALSTALAFTGLALANTRIDEAAFNTDDGKGIGHRAALASAPMWHFGRPRGSMPCYPQAGEVNGVQTEGNGQDNGIHGNLNNGCAYPGDWNGRNSPGAYFPTYYQSVKCPDDTWRTTYSIYFRHDSGHANDWESVATVWVRDGDLWRRDRLLIGQHGDWKTFAWGDIQNTVDGIPDQMDQDAKDRDHAKVYVGSFYHAVFQDRYTGVDTANPANPGAEFRSNDWYYLAIGDNDLARGDLIRTEWSYGSADTTPAALADPGNSAKYICNQ